MFSRRSNGFTLVEVMAAVGVFAFAVIGLMLALNVTIDAASATQREAMVRNELQDRLARMSVGSLREVTNTEEVNGVTYVEKIERTEITDDEKTILRGFWRLGASAQWTEEGGEQSWGVSHLVYRNE